MQTNKQANKQTNKQTCKQTKSKLITVLQNAAFPYVFKIGKYCCLSLLLLDW